MKSSREVDIDIKLIDMVDALKLSGKAMTALKILLADQELQAAQEFANTVSIVRLGYNDHGPVHMRTVAKTAIIMLELLKKAGIKTTIEANGCGDFEDSLIAVVISSMLHDIGMGMGRQNHELHSTIMAQPVIDNLLKQIYEDDFHKERWYAPLPWKESPVTWVQ